MGVLWWTFERGVTMMNAQVALWLRVVCCGLLATRRVRAPSHSSCKWYPSCVGGVLSGFVDQRRSVAVERVFLRDEIWWDYDLWC